jgi:hypothetical protein
MVAALVIVGAIGGAALVVVRRRPSDGDDDGTEASSDHELSEEERREVLKRLAGAAREAADSIENGKAESEASEPPVEATVEVRREEDGLEVGSIAVPETTLSIQAKVTEAAPEEVMALFSEPPREEKAPATPDNEELRLDALKRKYQDAIAHMPYGIPSAELREWDWVELASALATGPKRTVDGAGEVTEIDGRWYHSDIEEPTTFLKEHGAKPKADGGATNGKADLMVKLEERFILGEISEEAYLELREKYSN